MKKKVIPSIAFLLGAALVAIIITQILWLNNAYKLKEEQFNKAVADAMRTTIDKMEDRNNVAELLSTFEKRIGNASDTKMPAPAGKRKQPRAKSERGNLRPNEDAAQVVDALSFIDSLVNNSLSSSHFTFSDNSNRMSFRIITPDGIVENSVVVPNAKDIEAWESNQKKMMEQSAKAFERLRKSERKNIRRHTNLNRLGQQLEPHPTDIFPPEFQFDPAIRPVPPPQEAEPSRKNIEDFLRAHIEKRTRRIESTIRQMIVEFDTHSQPIEKRIKAAALDTTLKSELQSQGIAMPFEYAVYTDKTNAMTSIHSANFDAQKAETHKAALFPYDINSDSYSLRLQLSSPRKYILDSINLMMIGSIVLTAFILATFIITIRTLLRQKRMSEIKSDFVNNVTHEFKTPIATISLAVDSIENEKVINKQDTVKYFTNIIRDENQRMNRLVEQVLKMALVERAGLKQNPQTLDIHELINAAASHFELQIANKGGDITKEFKATNATVDADEMHILNAIINLIDNAIKYSQGAPHVKLCTCNVGNKITISVIDKGIGMNKEALRHIFDKFYRHTDGNVHNVKGFGLGLAFVKSIVEAHNGQIAVSSEPGRGSRFDITIPLKSTSNE